MPKLELERQKCIDLIQKYDISNHTEFAEKYYMEYGHTFTQGTISRALNKFHIEKIEGFYKYQSQKIDKEDETQRLLFNHCNYISLIHNDFFVFVLKCDIGTENIICKLIYEKFSTILHSTIPAYGSVVIMCKSKSNAKEIRGYLKTYIGNKNDKEDD